LGEAGEEFPLTEARERFSVQGVSLLHALWPVVFPAVEREFAQHRRPLWMTGHGMGGTIATLAAWRFHRKELPIHAVVSLGAFPIGDGDAERFVNNWLGPQLVRVVAPPDPVVGDQGAGQEVRLATDPRDVPINLSDLIAPIEAQFRAANTTINVLLTAMRGSAAEALAKVPPSLQESEYLAALLSREQSLLHYQMPDLHTVVSTVTTLLCLSAHDLERSYIPRLERLIPSPFVPWEVLRLALDYPELEAALLPRQRPRPAVFAPALRLTASLPTPTLHPEPRRADLDPRLNWLLARRRYGLSSPPSASLGRDEVAVFALVTDLQAWQAMSEVRPGADLGSPTEGERLVTARIPLSRIDGVRAHPCVKDLKAAEPLQPVLHSTITEIRAVPPPPAVCPGGSGVVLGVIDFGFDLAHRAFRNPDGSTRILALWDQTGMASPQSPCGYGRLHLREQIDHALQQPDPWAALGYYPPHDAHGTHVAHIAGGNSYACGPGQPDGPRGVAHRADLVFVELDYQGWANGSPPQRATGSFGDTVRLAEAIEFIFSFADGRPCVINVSMATNAGPHDGSTLVELAIDSQLRQGPNRAVVLAAGNDHDDSIHVKADVPPAGHFDLTWRLPPLRQRPVELQVWYSGSQRLTAEIITPTGSTLFTVPAGQTQERQVLGETLVFLANRLNDSRNQDNQIGVFMSEGAAAGEWVLRLHNLDGERAVPFHAWMEHQAPAGFVGAGVSPSHTLSTIACGHEAIAVGAFRAGNPWPISFFSAAGPTRDGRRKPELSAPGQNVWAAASGTGHGLRMESGTSMAAPAVAGLIALLLSEVHTQGESRSSAQIRQGLIDAAHKLLGFEWDPRYGFGRASRP
jgi:subtilisin family serine protease